MIYISTGHFQKQSTVESVSLLAQNGFKNIELSAGRYEASLPEGLQQLKRQYGLDFICHNYFPVSSSPFVLNMASLDDDIFLRTIEFFKEIIRLSRELGAVKFGFHAGFFYDISVREIGRMLKKTKLYDRRKCLDRFCEGYQEIKKAAGEIKIYIENNVISAANLREFGGENPLMLSSASDYAELKAKVDFNLLLDLGHLKVSAHSLKNEFEKEARILLEKSDYIHLSDNDGLLDAHRGLAFGSAMYKFLKTIDLKGKTITLECVDNVSLIRESYNLIKGLQ